MKMLEKAPDPKYDSLVKGSHLNPLYGGDSGKDPSIIYQLRRIETPIPLHNTHLIHLGKLCLESPATNRVVEQLTARFAGAGLPQAAPQDPQLGDDSSATYPGRAHQNV